MPETPKPKFPVRRRAGDAPPSASAPVPPATTVAPVNQPPPERMAPTGAPAATVVGVRKEIVVARRPARPPATRPPARTRPEAPAAAPAPARQEPPRKTPEEKAETKRQAANRQRGRRAVRAIAALDGREAEVVTALLELNGGTPWPWRRHVHKEFAARFALQFSIAREYLTALRRTLGLPIVGGDKDGPKLRPRAWIEQARATGDWGVFGPLHVPDAVLAGSSDDA
jgi:hypothetical protein